MKNAWQRSFESDGTGPETEHWRRAVGGLAIYETGATNLHAALEWPEDGSLVVFTRNPRPEYEEETSRVWQQLAMLYAKHVSDDRDVFEIMQSRTIAVTRDAFSQIELAGEKFNRSLRFCVADPESTISANTPDDITVPIGMEIAIGLRLPKAPDRAA